MVADLSPIPISKPPIIYAKLDSPNEVEDTRENEEISCKLTGNLENKRAFDPSSRLSCKTFDFDQTAQLKHENQTFSRSSGPT